MASRSFFAVTTSDIGSFCAVPGASVSNVISGWKLCKPSEVRAAVGRKVKRTKDHLRRRNEAFVRQGEWFSFPLPSYPSTQS